MVSCLDQILDHNTKPAAVISEDSCTKYTQFDMLTVFVEMTYPGDKLPGIVLIRYKGLVLLLKFGVRDMPGQSV